MDRVRSAIVTIFVCSWLTGCVALTKAIYYPERRPADRATQSIADRLTDSVEAKRIEVTVWGNPEWPTRIRNPVAIIIGTDEILMHVRVQRYFADKPDALAAIFGHELGHRFIGYPGDPDGEAKADAFGVLLAARAGFDPWTGAVQVCLYFMATKETDVEDTVHPPSEERCKVLMRAAAATGVPMPARKPKTE